MLSSLLKTQRSRHVFVLLASMVLGIATFLQHTKGHSHAGGSFTEHCEEEGNIWENDACVVETIVGPERFTDEEEYEQYMEQEEE